MYVSLEFVESERNETTPVYNVPRAYFSTNVKSEKDLPEYEAMFVPACTVCPSCITWFYRSRDVLAIIIGGPHTIIADWLAGWLAGLG